MAGTVYSRLRVPSEKRTISSVPPADETNVSVRRPVISTGKGAPIVRPTAGCVVVPKLIVVAGVGGRMMVILMVLVPVKPLASEAVNRTGKVPPTDVVPLITPVVVFNWSPAGKVLGKTDQV